MSNYVGSAKRGWFKTYLHSYVDGVLTKTLFDPGVVKLSLRNTTLGTEEVLTYGGTDPFDVQLTSSGSGSFEWYFVPLTPGYWEVKEEWQVTVGDQTLTVKGTPVGFWVEADPCAWVDRS